MDTIMDPAATNGATSTSMERDYETELLSIVASTCNAAREAARLDKDAAQEERRCVTLDDLKHGSHGEKHLRSHLVTVSSAAKKAMQFLIDFGRCLESEWSELSPSRARRSAIAWRNWKAMEERLSERSADNDEEDLAIILEALPSLAEDLLRGYGWARRRRALQKLAASLDETGAALEAIEEEEEASRSRRHCEPEARGT